MTKFRGGQSKRMAKLSQHVAHARTKLTQQKELAERILKLSEFARKLETEAEKVEPFYESAVDSELQAQAEARAQQELEEAGLKPDKAARKGSEDAGPMTGTGSALRSDGTPVPEHEYLDNFFRKYNKVTLDKLAIEKERERLRRENEELQSILKQVRCCPLPASPDRRLTAPPLWPLPSIWTASR